MVMYDYNRNKLLDELIKKRQAANIRDALLKVHKVIKAIVSSPMVYIMDNDCSSDLKEAMKN